MYDFTSAIVAPLPYNVNSARGKKRETSILKATPVLRKPNNPPSLGKQEKPENHGISGLYEKVLSHNMFTKHVLCFFVPSDVFLLFVTRPAEETNGGCQGTKHFQNNQNPKRLAHKKSHHWIIHIKNPVF